MTNLFLHIFFFKKSALACLLTIASRPESVSPGSHEAVVGGPVRGPCPRASAGQLRHILQHKAYLQGQV